MAFFKAIFHISKKRGKEKRSTKKVCYTNLKEKKNGCVVHDVHTTHFLERAKSGRVLKGNFPSTHIAMFRTFFR